MCLIKGKSDKETGVSTYEQARRLGLRKMPTPFSIRTVEDQAVDVRSHSWTIGRSEIDERREE